jgi:hypothetical protein
MATGHDAGPPRKNPAYSPPWPGGGEPPRRLVAGAPARPARARAAAWSVLQQSPPLFGRCQPFRRLRDLVDLNKLTGQRPQARFAAALRARRCSRVAALRLPGPKM